ncbi:MAG: carboxypeptidase, partial [Cypionkella sp.]|nr:carboxypeptidase [Cypionkella sp.]
MTSNTAYSDLMAYQRDTEALGKIAERLGWDQETMMPSGSADQRGTEMAAMEGIMHARRCNPQIGEWLAQAEASDSVARAQLYQIDRSHKRAVKVPTDLAQELARVTSVSQGIWARARAAEKVTDFLPTMQKVIDLRRQEAAALADGGDLYDALIDDYEPEATAASLGGMFDRMRPRLVALREEILGAKAPVGLRGNFPQADQLRLARDVATAFGYDWSRGRIDLAVHPFSSGGGDDSRITTRVVERDPFNCLYSTIHEVGHSSYELAIDRDFGMTPL